MSNDIEIDDLNKSLENIKKIMKERNQSKIVSLPGWVESKLAAPNAVFRSGLFPALNKKIPRRFLKALKLGSVSGLEVIFTGEQFDQSDLDVYLELINLAKSQDLGTLINFSAHSLLKALGRSTGSSDHKWLHSVLIRLRGGTIEITDRSKRYIGGLIEGGERDEITKRYKFHISPGLSVLFGFGMWAAIDRDQRHTLKSDSVAKALHAYYSTHVGPCYHNYETLAGIVGLVNKSSRHVKGALIAAHEKLKLIGFLLDYVANPKSIEVTLTMTPGQVRHSIRKQTKKPK